MSGMYPHSPQTPLGGALVDRELRGEERQAALDQVASLPSLMIDREAEISFEMIATGVFSPLTGPLGSADNEAVLDHGRLADGTPWPIPFSFAPAGERNQAAVRRIEPGHRVVLIDRTHRPVAFLDVRERYPYDRDRRARILFGTTEPQAHPGVASIHRRMGAFSLGGQILLLNRPSWGAFERYRQTPSETYDLLYREHKFKRVAGFVTGANPPHIGHEYMHRVALDLVDAVLLLPQVEMERPEFIQAPYRIMALEALRDAYYPPFTALLAALRTNYLFAGPREAVLHALIMRNYGCTHALIGRDHAGVRDIYDPYAGQRAFADYDPGELGIEPLFFSEVFYCTRCRMPVTEKTCAHDTRYRLQISGTGIREVLRRGYFPPKEICRPEVSHIAIQGVVPRSGSREGGGLYPVGQTVRSLFPFYEVAQRLGGGLRPGGPVAPEAMGERDLQAALLDVRQHADDVYGEVFDEMATASEPNRSLASRWRTEAREILVDHQLALVDRLSHDGDGAGLSDGPSSPADQRADVGRAEQVLRGHPRPLHPQEGWERMAGPDPAADEEIR
jgi:sulfate adenylyltransferase